MGNIPFRFPTSAEWDKLCDICGNRNVILHWGKMFAWCEDIVMEGQSVRRVCRGYISPRYWGSNSASYRDVSVGFRPVFGVLGPDALGFEDGAIVTAGTLYMNGAPVKAPKGSRGNVDIQDYKHGAILEVRDPISDPDYQIKAIKVGKVFISDRCLLKNISWDDIADNM